MKLNNIKNFNLVFSGYNTKNYTTLGNYKGLIVSNAIEGENESISISLNDGGNCFVYPNNEIAKQNLMKILPVIKNGHIGKPLEDLLNFEFVIAERLS